MAHAKLNIRPLLLFFSAIVLCLGCVSCANTPPVAPRAATDIPMTAPTRPQDAFIKDNINTLKAHYPPPALVTPDYQPVSDDISPAKSRMVNIQARNSSLGDILHVIADAAGLNLVINDGVQQDRTITITLKRVTADDALATILNSADYFYTIKDNILSVEATGTKLFELGHPALVQGFTVDVGGDILGSAAALTASGSGSSGSSSSGGSGSGGSTNMKGAITQSIKADSKAFDFWESLEKSLITLIQKQTPAATAATPATSAAAATMQANVPQQHVVVNRLTGTIVVTASRRNLISVERYLENIRAALNRQVLIEARIIEVQLKDELTFGIDWSFLSNIDNFTMLGGGFGALKEASLSATLDAKNPSFRIGAITSGNKGSISGVLDALQKQGEVKTLSNPRVNVMNGQTALLSVGTNTNYLSKVTTTNSGGNNNVVTYTTDTSNVLSGIMIGLAPSINSKGEISMTVTPIISHLVKLDPVDVGSGDNKTQIKLPIVDLRELSTTVKVRNGDMIVIGGLISNKNRMDDSKIPFLGDIPWLGTLFTRKDYEDTRTELVVVLQPYLVGSN